MSERLSDSHAVEAAKERAKQLLAQARAGDATVIRELRKILPRLAGHDDAAFAANVKLADVQHAIAVSRGQKSWAELRRILEQVDPLQMQAERFLHAIREEDGMRAQELLAAHPGIADYSIHAAAAACKPEAVKRFLADNPALVNAPAPPNKAEPIIYACSTPLHNLNEQLKASNAQCVQLLLDAGANPNAFIMFDGAEGEAPISVLYFAAVSNNVAATRALLASGANPNDGESVYHAAERNNRECLQLLVSHGAEISKPHARWGNTPLYFLAGYKPFSKLCASSELGMRWLLEHGADPNVASHDGESDSTSVTRAEMPLHRVAAYGKGRSVAQMLVEHGALVDARRGDGKTAYVLAVRTGNHDVADYLLSVGADVNELSDTDELIGACLSGDETSVRAIVSAHPDVTSTFTKDDQRAIVLAAEEGREASVRLMVSLGWDLATEGEWGGTPLHLAAWLGRAKMVRLLIELGAPINFRDSMYGSSPLAWTAHGSTNSHQGTDDDYAAVASMLIDAGSTREASYNKWNEAPEGMASKAVTRVLKERGFFV